MKGSPNFGRVLPQLPFHPYLPTPLLSHRRRRRRWRNRRDEKRRPAVAADAAATMVRAAAESENAAEIDENVIHLETTSKTAPGDARLIQKAASVFQRVAAPPGEKREIPNLEEEAVTK